MVRYRQLLIAVMACSFWDILFAALARMLRDAYVAEHVVCGAGAHLAGHVVHQWARLTSSSAPAQLISYLGCEELSPSRKSVDLATFDVEYPVGPRKYDMISTILPAPVERPLNNWPEQSNYMVPRS